MVNKKSFKPPVQMAEVKIPAKVSLSDQQYEDIFAAVLQSSQPESVIKSPTYAKSPGHNVALSPKESASVENSQNGPSSEKNQKEGEVEKEKNTDSTVHTINTDEFTKNATFSTPVKIIQPRSFKAALQSLRNKLNDSSLSESLSESIDHSLVELWDPANQLSQIPKGMTKRERLQWLQDRRGTGLWVKCDNSDCEKWRWLDTADPVDVPKLWTCNLNPDKDFASCSVPEKPIPLRIEEDTIHNCFTAGSIVWAKMPGYPWWPAMVDDCPDCEQYYWLDNEYADIPSSYHVVFFDEKEISRRWIPVDDLLSFKQRPELQKLFKIKPYQRKRFEISVKKAKEALKLSIKERLQRHSFLALWKGEIPEDSDTCSSDSDSEIPLNSQDFNRYIKKRIYRRKKKLAGLPESNENSFKSVGKKRARKISTDSNKSITENDKPAKVRRTKDKNELSSNAPLRRSPRLSTESRVSNSSKKSSYNPAELRRSPRLSTESRNSVKLSSPKKNGKFEKENKTHKKRLISEDDEPKKKSLSKSEEKATKKKIYSEKNSTGENFKEKNKNSKPFVAPKKPTIKKSPKTNKKSSINEDNSLDLPKEHSEQKKSVPNEPKNQKPVESLNRSFPTIPTDHLNQADSVSTDSVSLNGSFSTQENKKPKLGIRTGLKKPKKTFMTPAKFDNDETLAILQTPIASLVSSNLGAISESE